MPKLIDGGKMIGLLGYLIEATDNKLEKNLLWHILEEIESGKVDPTPPVQPDIKVGDKVRHKQYKSYGDGVVGEISGSGKSAWVRPWSAYYRLDKLEVIQPDTGEVITDEQR